MLNRSPVWVVREVFPSLAQPCPSDLATLLCLAVCSPVPLSLSPPRYAVSMLVLLSSSQVPSSYKGLRRLSSSADQASLDRGLAQERQTLNSF